MKEKKEFGIVGLGRMGANPSRQALEKGFKVAGCTLGGVPDELRRMGIIALDAISGFRNALPAPRIVYLYVPAGRAVDDLIEEIADVLERGDIIVDGGNSYWGDSIRRYKQLRKKGLEFVDLGTSGGVEGARSGACFMAGGDERAVAMEAPVPAISTAVMQLFNSRDEKKTRARAIDVMRNEFGGHALGKSEPAERERRTGSVGEIVREAEEKTKAGVP